ncbi:MAG: RNA chaperone Hfq [Rhodobacteraceae bacterium]|nr:RNA chaperone Hfq [Paracoccaceae bacterium]MCY4197052.1 RNA chaperone Hfq [Paracoccaceae bacterium]MCY4327759.1 RNA chaperone Hfq [Paracoccaceae bacterium]
MEHETPHLQKLFLNTLRKTRAPVTVFLVSGVKLTGHITSFDNFCLLLKRDIHAQLVYKHAVSTIVPVEPIYLDVDQSPEE